MLNKSLLKIYFYIALIIFSNFLSCGKKIQLESYLKNNFKWAMYGQFPQRKFFIDDTLKLPLKINFKTELKAGLNYSSVTAMDEFLFVGDLKGNVYKIDLNSGQIKNYNNFKQPILTSIVVNENSLIFPVAASKGRNSFLIVYNLVQGMEKSKLAVEGSIEKEILPVNKNIFFTTINGTIYKVNQEHIFDWKINLKSQIYCHPAVVGEFIVTATIDGTLYFITFTGKIFKEIKLNNRIKSGFCVDGSRVYFGDEGGVFYCYDKDQERFVFSKKLDVSINAIPSFDNESIFIGDLRGNVFSLNKQTGEVNWKKQLGGLINNSILIVGDKLVVPNFQKKIFILDKYTGNILQEIEFEGRVKLSPVYIKNKLILGYDDKKIVALSY